VLAAAVDVYWNALDRVLTSACSALGSCTREYVIERIPHRRASANRPNWLLSSLPGRRFRHPGGSPSVTSQMIVAMNPA
jgi:hypothetical protein